MFGTVHHTGYLTDNLDQAIAFYETNFGGKVLKRVPGASGSDVAFISVGDAEVELIQPGEKERLGGRTGLIIDHISYFVPDLDKTIAQLTEKGLKFAGEVVTSPLGYRIIYFDASTALGTRIHLTEERK